MKRFSYAMVMAVALVVMISSFAVAGGPECQATASNKEGCADKATAASNKEGCADKAACEAAVADMNECCVAAVKAGKGCHGMEADVLKASFDEKVAYHKASAEVKGDMHKCCAASMDAGKGCCGKDADALKADYDKKVETKAKKVATTDKESADS